MGILFFLFFSIGRHCPAAPTALSSPFTKIKIQCKYLHCSIAPLRRGLQAERELLFSGDGLTVVSWALFRIGAARLLQVYKALGPVQCQSTEQINTTIYIGPVVRTIDWTKNTPILTGWQHARIAPKLNSKCDVYATYLLSRRAPRFENGKYRHCHCVQQLRSSRPP